MTGRARFWVFGKLAFIEGVVVEASRHGLRIELSPAVPARLVRAGDRRRLELWTDTGDTFGSIGEVRHVSACGVGLSVDDRVPLEFFGSFSPAEPSGSTPGCCEAGHDVSIPAPRSP